MSAIPTFWPGYRTILRAAIHSYGGKQVGTQGDVFLITFPRASAAVRAAVEIQHQIAMFEWHDGVQVRLRIGLRTGKPWMA
jgi:class 3 adenylate cyclase